MLEIQNLIFGYGDKELFHQAELKIYQGEHVGIVGLNGTGKTTFLNLLCHRLLPDEGNISWDRHTTFSYLDQHLAIYDDQTVQAYLYDVYQPLFQKEEEMNRLYQSLETVDPSHYDKILDKAYRLQNELEEHGFYMIKSRIGNVINGLGIRIEEQQLIRHLSGGQRAKVFLGKMLLEDKDVLILDEPTNFLDAQHVDWLMKFLSSYKNACLVVSHNTEFLNGIATAIVAIENKKLVKYKGNYEDYLNQRTMKIETYEKEYQRQQEFIKKTQDFIQKNIVRASTTKRAQSRRKMLEKIDVLERPQAEKKVHFCFDFTKSFNTKCVVVNQLAIGYDYPILGNINFNINFGEKVVIIGKNGVGKTTLLKTLLQEIPPLEGNFKVSPYNDVSYFQQEVPIHDTTAIEFFREDYPLMNDLEIRNILAQYGIIGELAIKSMKQLSGGEVTKVRFAKMSLTSSNFLILDEPTNHLDRNAKSSLFHAISTYPGTVILVSHEKYFYKQLAMREIKF
ncbi:MAG: ABC-F family ATP-binding cassette domain-containing protein [Bacilli bacterium]|nr:ABC-F family ATP-binding cassette domain-containing protein [Bacilli bacterium]